MKIDAEILKEFIWIVLSIMVVTVLVNIVTTALELGFTVTPIATGFVLLIYYLFRRDTYDR